MKATVLTNPQDSKMAGALAELERGVHAALETYSNVHRGSGHNSMVPTQLYEQARDIVLKYLGLSKDKHVAIFCTPKRTEMLRAQLAGGLFKSVKPRHRPGTGPSTALPFSKTMASNLTSSSSSLCHSLY